MPGSPALYCQAFPWGSAAVSTTQELIGSVANALTQSGKYSDIQIQDNGNGVACRTANSHNFVFCVGGNGHSTTVVVATAGDDAFQTKQDIVARIHAIKFL